jgi:hypothetical protein
VGIGTSSPTQKLDVFGGAGAAVSLVRAASGQNAFFSVIGNGNSFLSTSFDIIQDSTNLAQIVQRANAAMAFSTNNTERMRIDTSGNLLVGTTSAVAKLTIVSPGATNATKGIQLNNSSGTELLAIVSDGSFFTGTAASSPYNSTTGSAANAFITSGGQLQRSTSSLKYKTDVQDATHGLAEVLQLRPVTYKGKNDGDTIFGGLIAEEVHAAGLTEFVQYAEDGSPDALAYGNMVSLLTKAIQEQQALITSLTTRITALEST